MNNKQFYNFKVLVYAMLAGILANVTDSNIVKVLTLVVMLICAVVYVVTNFNDWFGKKKDKNISKTITQEYYVVEKDGLMYGTKYVKLNDNDKLDEYQDFIDPYEPFDENSNILDAPLTPVVKLSRESQKKNVGNDSIFKHPVDKEQFDKDKKDMVVRKVRVTTTIEHLEDTPFLDA